ncbi:MAG: hypothetical protein O2890_08990 [Cyanobacteria bacterium]|nr:hypothetical protein [Cyanobacteriota bacterium]MDA0866541.1 hypothetical protein [Cyanobacteriota bacterium]
MGQPEQSHWNSEEIRIAQAALQKAHASEIAALISYVQVQASSVTAPEDVWQLHDFLSAKRHDIDGKYDDRESFLMYTLSRLIKDGLLTLAELEGLSVDKKTKINLLTRM